MKSRALLCASPFPATFTGRPAPHCGPAVGGSFIPTPCLTPLLSDSIWPPNPWAATSSRCHCPSPSDKAWITHSIRSALRMRIVHPRENLTGWQFPVPIGYPPGLYEANGYQLCLLSGRTHLVVFGGELFGARSVAAGAGWSQILGVYHGARGCVAVVGGSGDVAGGSGGF